MAWSYIQHWSIAIRAMLITTVGMTWKNWILNIDSTIYVDIEHFMCHTMLYVVDTLHIRSVTDEAVEKSEEDEAPAFCPFTFLFRFSIFDSRFSHLSIKAAL